MVFREDQSFEVAQGGRPSTLDVAAASPSFDNGEDAGVADENAPVFTTPELRLTGNAERDNAVREQFAYRQGPSVVLAKRILTLCANPFRVGDACLALADRLSEKLAKKSPEHDTDRILNFIRELLQHAKANFSKATEPSPRIEVCERYTRYVDLLRMIVSSKDEYTTTLSALDDPAQARVLRDKLAADDRMELALDVAARCNVEAAPVWSAWGLVKLRMRQFLPARDKLKNFFATTSDLASRNKVLVSIVTTLEQSRNNDLSRLKELQGKLIEFYQSSGRRPGDLADGADERDMIKQKYSPVSASINDRINDVSTLNRSRFEEFYIQTYGTPQELVLFNVKHGFLDRACQIIVEQDLGAQLFFDEILTPCMDNGALATLKAALAANEQATPGAAAKHAEYLIGACRHFLRERQLRRLYVLQLFLNDLVRAGLTCVYLYMEHAENDGDLEDPQQFLPRAKAHLEAGLAYGRSVPRVSTMPFGDSDGDASETRSKADLAPLGAVMPDRDAQRCLTTVQMQQDVAAIFLKELRRVVKAGDASAAALQKELSSITLFGGARSKGEVAMKLVMLDSFDLAFRIMQEYRLNTVEVFQNAVRALGRARQVGKIGDFLKNIKGTVPDDDWDSVVDAVINVFARDVNDVKTAEKYIPMLVDEDVQIGAYITVNKLRAAYVIAARLDRPAQVSRIRAEALRTGQESVVKLCERFLAGNKEAAA